MLIEFSLITSSLALLVAIYFIKRLLLSSSRSQLPLPPGSLGWPLIGETLEFSKAAASGRPERFVLERMEKHNSDVIKTSLLGETVVVFRGQAGNKFLFGNDNKLVSAWCPAPIRKLFRKAFINIPPKAALRTRSMLMTFLNPNTLKTYVEIIDAVTQEHFTKHWDGKDELQVHSVVKLYTFDLACRLFMSKNNLLGLSKFTEKFKVMARGILELPINLPGTRFRKAMKAADFIREEIVEIIRQRRDDLKNLKASSTQDLLSHLLTAEERGGGSMPDAEIIDNILLLLYSSFDTASSVMVSLMSYLAKFPDVYESVLKEQMEIAATKGAGEMLKWEDLQRMRYSWLVASEVMRLRPPAAGTFRQAIVDFEYAGYRIPKGYKIYVSIGSTHQNPILFPNPEDLDPSRFGSAPAPYSYVPFGGGLRICPGIEYARLEILVFLHNVVKSFKWELKNPDERFGYDEYILAHYEGLPIRLEPRQRTT